MAKAKTHEEALAQVEATKEALKEARTALREFKSENKIKRDVVPTDEKIAKKLEVLEAKAEKAREASEEATALEKELRPRKERVSKYEYPAGMEDEKEKKRYRAKMRREAKGESKPKKEKKEETAAPAKKSIKKKADAGEEGTED